MPFASNTQPNHGEEIKTYGRDHLSLHIITELPFEAVVWLLVEVEVHTHDGKTASAFGGMEDIVFTHQLLHIAHQH